KAATEGKVALAESSFGYAALAGELYPELSVLEHLELVADLRGCDPRSQDLMSLVGLTSASSTQAKAISSGMRARLKLAIAMQATRALLILDEPSAGLDTQGVELLAGVVTGQLDHGAVLLATNDPAERRLGTHELALG